MRNFFIADVRKSSLRGRFAAAVVTVVFFKGTNYLLAGLNVGRVMLGKWIAIGLTAWGGEVAYESFARNQEMQKKTDVLCGLKTSDPNIIERRSQCLTDKSFAKAAEISEQFKRVAEANSKFLAQLMLSNDLRAETLALQKEIGKEKNQTRIKHLQLKLEKVSDQYKQVELSLKIS